MQSIGQSYKIEEKTKKIGERHLLLGQLYELYLSPTEALHRKKENWKRYISWLRENKTPDSKENREKFKKDKKFLREFKISLFGKYLSHIPTQDLYYCVSYCKDRNHSGLSCASWLFSKIK